MHQAIRKWGNSAAIRIPAVLMQALKMHIDHQVSIEEQDGQLIITPLSEKPELTPDLECMLDQITDANCHSDLSFGEPEGGEIL